MQSQTSEQLLKLSRPVQVLPGRTLPKTGFLIVCPDSIFVSQSQYFVSFSTLGVDTLCNHDRLMARIKLLHA